MNLLPELFKAVHVPFDILKEVNELTEKDMNRFGLQVYYPDMDTYYRASNIMNALSFEDNICLIDARKKGWAVVTNDKRMKRECNDAGVQTFWGLQVMIVMAERRLLSKREALKTAEEICEVNPRISKKVLDDFKEKV